MITVPEHEDAWTSQVHLRVITILKNGNPVGYINIGSGDKWEKILQGLQKNLSDK